MNDEELWQAYSWPEKCLRVNFVVTLDGHIRGREGLSGSLSDEEDRRIFAMQRAGCDAVLVGAGTIRAEKYGPIAIKPQWQQFRTQKHAPELIAVSASGNVPEIEGLQVVDGSDLPALRERYPRILCEGGPHLFASLLKQDLVDEVALTMTGYFGGSGQLVPAAVSEQATPKHVHAHGNSLFTLWSLR